MPSVIERASVSVELLMAYTEEVLQSVMLLFTMYILSLGLFSVALELTGLTLMESVTGAWTAIFNIGPAFGPSVGPTGSVQAFPEAAKALMILAMAVEMGLNSIQTYVMWNFHEQQRGQLEWGGRRNITHFIDLAAQRNLSVVVRIGPYVCAEWTYGGIPAWLGLKTGVAFRQTNKLWQDAMEKWFALVVRRMAEASRSASDSIGANLPRAR